MPDDPKPLQSLDKSQLREQRLRVSNGNGKTVTPGKMALTRRDPTFQVPTEWTTVVDSPRRSRLLAAMFGDEYRGA